MISRIRTSLILLLLAIVVWLFAESESLGEVEQNARIEFNTAQDDRDQLLVRAVDFDGRITVSLKGAQSSIQRARAALEGVLRLEPGMPGVPDSGGRHTIDLLDILSRLPALRATGITIDLVQPRRVTIEIEELVVRSFPIEAVIPEVEILGDITIVPDRAEVRLPRSLADTLTEATGVLARVPSPRPLPPGTHTLQNIPLLLPAEMEDVRGVSLLTRRATLEFTIRSTLTTETFDSIPVQVLLPPIETGDWRIVLDEEDQFVRAEFSGPSEIIEQLRNGETRLVAVFSLTDVELSAAITSKQLRIMVLTDATPAPLPEGLTITSPPQSARFTIQRVSQ